MSWKGVLTTILSVIPMLLVVAVAVWLYTWTTEYSSKSPDGSREVRVQTRACLADCVLRIHAISGLTRAEIARDNDCIFRDASTEWRNTIVEVHVKTTFCGRLTATYNFATGEHTNSRVWR